MKVKSIRWKGAGGATKHESVLELPETGIVLITGPNGVGKSSAIEVLHEVIMGKKLGKRSAWRPNMRSHGIVELANGLTVHATNSPSNKNDLKLSGAGTATAGTLTKSRTELAKYTPTSSLWRFSCHLSGETISSFSAASDTEKKSAVANLMQLGFFDAEAKKYKKTYDQTKDDLKSAESDFRVSESALTTLQAQVDALAGVPDVVDDSQLDQMRGEVAKLKDIIASSDKQMLALQKTETSISHSIAKVKEKVRLATLKANRLAGVRDSIASKGACPTCKQPTNDTSAVDIELAQAQEELSQAEAQVDPVQAEDLQTTRSLYEGYKTERDVAKQQALVIATQGKTLAQAAKSSSGKEAQLTLLRSQLEAATTRHAESTVKLELADTALKVKTLVRQALSPQGLQAMLIQSGLAAVQRATNQFMASLFPAKPSIGVEMTLEQGTLKMLIHGIHKLPKKYDDCSSGEKQKIDFSIVFAFGESARIAQDIESTTLWIDEPLTYLDKEGRAEACQLITELAKKHCVVLISHVDDVHAGIRPTKTYQVTEGGLYTEI